ncbi:hypothetical protein [Streptomyces kanamyceticus]|uniref:Uncharacterized protein n=1 Tax=Streptomyces kanamyceticus TaxID=1967 RepID=A0A5J6GPH1_STRKN|nr:hypothetical protein [Streptomyces kanamyceticus]QEU96284.1 hypothetical protein CP970_39910 [Streptomyces kanamyceticus]
MGKTNTGIWVERTRPRRTLRRTAVGIAVPMAAVASLLVLTPSGTAAADQGGASGVAPAAAYGELRNNTRWTMEYAYFSGNAHRCDVWNNSLTARKDNWKNLPCEQIALKAGKKAGGPGDDVDGFTFEDRAYDLYMQFGSGDNKKMKYMGGFKKGVWTKITDIDNARCETLGSVARCYVTFP